MTDQLAEATVLSFGKREDHVSRLRTEELDLLVVGGGITGSGIALDAASRGLRVGLVDKADFAVGTSSRSTKLVHGGLRYLAQLEFVLTHEALTERYVLAALAPRLVEWLPFVLPIFGNPIELGKMAVGLWLYDALAAMRAPTLHRWLYRREVMKTAPGINEQGLLGGFVYSDCRTDDVRITLEVLRTAVARGAAIANYTEVTGFLKAGGRAVGVSARDRRAGVDYEIRARKIVLATGVWIDRLIKLDDPAAMPRVRPAKGVHLVVPRSRLDFDSALFLPTAPDGRLIFTIPWQGATLIGTTDTDYDGAYESPFATTADVDYLLESVNRAFPSAGLTPDDVVSLQAGLRPLIAEAKGETTKISREDRVYETESGVIAIAGGKLTTYRRMAERTTDLVVRRLRESGLDVPRYVCLTDRIPLGAFAPAPVDPEVPGVDSATADHLVRSYGSNAPAVADLVRARPDLGQPIVAGLPNIRAEIVHAARHELAQTVADVLARRAHVVQLDREQGRSAAVEAARLMGEELGWSPEQIAAEAAAFEQDIRQFSPRHVAPA